MSTILNQTPFWKPAILVALFYFVGQGQASAQTGEKPDPKATEVWLPEPARVLPSDVPDGPPSDAVVLIGKVFEADKWLSSKDSSISWLFSEGALTVKPRSGAIHTRDKFGSVQLHIEWLPPAKLEGEGQGRGNSGVFFMGEYELQILDSRVSKTYANGQAGSIYKQFAPLVNAMRPDGWQIFDVVFNAPRFDAAGGLLQPATMTAWHNGVLIQNNAVLGGGTAYVGKRKYKAHGPAPFILQDHGNTTSFRNMWVRRLD